MIAAVATLLANFMVLIAILLAVKYLASKLSPALVRRHCRSRLLLFALVALFLAGAALRAIVNGSPPLHARSLRMGANTSGAGSTSKSDSSSGSSRSSMKPSSGGSSKSNTSGSGSSKGTSTRSSTSGAGSTSSSGSRSSSLSSSSSSSSSSLSSSKSSNRSSVGGSDAAGEGLPVSGLVFWSSDYHITPPGDVAEILKEFGSRMIDKSLSGHCQYRGTCATDLRVINGNNAFDGGPCPNTLRRELYVEWKCGRVHRATRLFTLFAS